jgi:quinohemoprotein ethanol dehydrogenase
MFDRRRLFAVASLFGTLVMAAAMSGQQSNDDWRNAPGKEWPLYGGDWGNTRYSTLAEINTTNIKKLGSAWFRALDNTSRSTPVVKDGLMFLCSASHVYALNAKTGEIVWTYRPEGSAPTSKGVAVGGGLVYLGTRDAHIVALKQKTGELVWSQRIGDDPAPRGESVSSAPTYAAGLVISGMGNGDFGLDGRVAAFDAETGQQVWRFNTIPEPGEFGHETWPQNSDVWKAGGGGVWMTPAVDVDLGLIYFGAGNALPQFGGELRAGDNLFNAAVVALELKTGKLRWYYQLVHHDIWDHDLGTPMVLYDATVGGKPVKSIAAMRTDGYLFLLNRETGKPILPIEERAVKQDSRLKTAATQPFPIGADRIGPDCVDPSMIPAGFLPTCWFEPLYFDRPNAVYPGIDMRAAPISYDPQTGYFYAAGTNGPWWYRRVENPYVFLPLRIPGQQEHGILAAIDSRTDKLVWQKQVPYGLVSGGGTMTTAGGLMFHAEPDGNFQAYDAKTGDLLWHFQTGFESDPTAVGPASGASMTYAIDGEQYVAVLGGRGVLAFKLGGNLKQFPAPTPPPPVYSFTGPLVDLRADDGYEIGIGKYIKDNWGYGYYDENAFGPVRVRIKVGTTVRWMNYGVQTHTAMAQDGSWSTGPILPGKSGSVTFDKPGEYTYICQEHPWALAELVVTDDSQEGIYSLEQADRGKTQYTENCSRCHLDNLKGTGTATALAGGAFTQQWQNHNLAELFDRIRSTMPQDNPGSLSAPATADILAFLLQANGFLPGKTELKGDQATLRGIPFEKKDSR